jgi:hypothetical protein
MPQPQILSDQIAGGGTPSSVGIYSGTATLSAGQVDVSTTAVAADSVIQLTYGAISGTQGAFLRVGEITPGSSFRIISQTGAADTSDVNWVIVN